MLNWDLVLLGEQRRPLETLAPYKSIVDLDLSLGILFVCFQVFRNYNFFSMP